jgi:hypothetical protein
VSLTLAYLLQVYNAVQRRNSLALELHLLTGATGDSATLLAGLGPRGEFGTGQSNVVQIANSLVQLKEALHVYPVLFYFRYPDPLYSIARLTLVTLDAVAIAKAALPERYAPFTESAALTGLGRAAIVLQTTVEQAFLQEPSEERPHESPGKAALHRRFAHAVRQLRDAGIEVVADQHAAAERYARLRDDWAPRSLRIGDYEAFEKAAVDVAVYGNPGDDRETLPQRRDRLV